jgi:hypothetical protein
MPQLIILKTHNLIFSQELKLDYCLPGKVLLKPGCFFTLRYTGVFPEYKVLPEVTFRHMHTIHVLYPAPICNLYMPGYLSITQNESSRTGNYNAMPQCSISKQKSILRQEIHKHTENRKTEINKDSSFQDFSETTCIPEPRAQNHSEHKTSS